MGIKLLIIFASVQVFTYIVCEITYRLNHKPFDKKKHMDKVFKNILKDK